jgi:hypothetical protein
MWPSSFSLLREINSPLKDGTRQKELDLKRTVDYSQVPKEDHFGKQRDYFKATFKVQLEHELELQKMKTGDTGVGQVDPKAPKSIGDRYSAIGTRGNMQLHNKLIYLSGFKCDPATQEYAVQI